MFYQKIRMNEAEDGEGMKEMRGFVLFCCWLLSKREYWWDRDGMLHRTLSAFRPVQVSCCKKFWPFVAKLINLLFIQHSLDTGVITEAQLKAMMCYQVFFYILILFVLAKGCYIQKLKSSKNNPASAIINLDSSSEISMKTWSSHPFH